MKKQTSIYCILLSTLVVFIFSACFRMSGEYPWPIGEESTIEIEGEGLIILSLVEGSLSLIGSDFVFANTGSVAVEYGSAEFFLQIEIDNKWYDLNWMDTEEKKGLTFGMAELLCTLNAYEEKTFSADWSSTYNELPKGTYRFVKEFYLRSRDDYTPGRYFYGACTFTIQ